MFVLKFLLRLFPLYRACLTTLVTDLTMLITYAF